MQFDLHLFGQSFIVLPQDFDHLVPTEVIRQIAAFRQHLPQHGSTQKHPVFLSMGTGSHRRHTVAFVAVEGPVDLERGAEQCFARLRGARNLIEDGLGFKHTVEVAHTGVVTADDHAGASVVLTEGGMEQAFSGARISHIQRVAALHHVILHKIVFHQHVDTFHPDIRRNITRFQVADQGVDVYAVTDFHRDLAKVFMGSVHGVSELKGSHLAPPFFFENLPRLFGSHVSAGIFGGIFRFSQNLDGTGQVQFLLVHDHLNAGMILCRDFPEFLGRGGAFTHIDLLAFVFLVRLGHLEFFRDLHGGHDFIGLRVEQGDFFAVCNAVGIFFGCRQGYRNRPEGSVCRQEIIAYTLPVRLGHESGERAESADSHHDQVTLFPGGNR